MQKQSMLKSLLVVPIVLGVVGVSQQLVHADNGTNNYTIDPRFNGNAEIGQTHTVTAKYWFDHAGPGITNYPAFDDSTTPRRNGFWAGHRQYSYKYEFLSMNRIKVFANSGSYKVLENTANNSGDGFYDTDDLSRNGVKTFIESGVHTSEKRTASKYLLRNNRLDGFDEINKIKQYVNDWNKNGIGYGSAHFNQRISFTKNEYYYEFGNGFRTDFLARAENNSDKIYPMYSIGRAYNTELHNGTATWYARPLYSMALTPAAIKWINNTTTMVNYKNWGGTAAGGNIAPSGEYKINANHDSDRKMLSWPGGHAATVNKFYTTGDKVVYRNMSPIIQFGINQGVNKNDGLSALVPGQVFKQSVWIPDQLDYKDGTARVYAIKTDGSRQDVTSKFTIKWDNWVKNYSRNGSTNSNYHRLVAQVNHLDSKLEGGYNKENTVGYSLMVPLTVNTKGVDRGVYLIRGGSQILDGQWHDTGDDVFKTYYPDKPAAGPTMMNATVYTNDSNTDFTENKKFYDKEYANNKSFRTNEKDGYFVWHTMKKSPDLPSDVSSNKGSDSGLTTWQNTQPMTITIPYSKGNVKVIGAQVAVKRLNDGYPIDHRYTIGTNGITGKDNGDSYTITIPATLLNARRNEDTRWGAALKYKVTNQFSGNGITINSTASIHDEPSGNVKSNNVRNYLITPQSRTTFDTGAGMFDANANNSVHLLNDQPFAWNTNWQYGYSKAPAATGAGEPLTKQTQSITLKGRQLVDATGVTVFDGADRAVWTGTLPANGTGTLVGKGLVSGFDKNSFTATVKNGRNLDADKTVTVTTNAATLNNANYYKPVNGYYRFRINMHTDALKDTEKSSEVTNTVSGYGGGFHPTANVVSSDNLMPNVSTYLSQVNSAAMPKMLIAKHGRWPSNANDTMNDYNYDHSSIQAREVEDLLVAGYRGNQDTKTEAYSANFQLTAWINYNSPNNRALKFTSLNDIKIRAYDSSGKVVDVTNDFDIALTEDNNHIVAKLKTDVQNRMTGKSGVHDNRLYIMSAPFKNQTDGKTSIKNVVDAHIWQHGQKYRANQVSEIVPPETPFVYGYSATSAADSFDPKNPEKVQGKIDSGIGDGTNTSAQISTAKVQWVMREQLGDMAYKYPQKYDYSQFYAQFPDAPLFQYGRNPSWHVYNEKGANVSSQFTGSKVGSQGYKISASKNFLSNKSSYGHMYYFVLDTNNQNSHAKRQDMANIATTGKTFDWFRDYLSSNSHWYSKMGIGNTVKNVPAQNMDLPHRNNLLAINNVNSGLNETNAQLNDVPFNKDNDSHYKIQNVALNRPTAGYTVSGATGQFTSTGRRYETYKTSFASFGDVKQEQIDKNSVKIKDDVTGKDVTSDYIVTFPDSTHVVVEMKAAAIDRLTKYYGQESPTKGASGWNASDIVSFKVNTWGDRSKDSKVQWYSTHMINGVTDSKSTEYVTVPKAHAGSKQIYVSPAGQNKWQASDLRLKKVTDLVDLKINVTVPDDLHNANFTDFVIHNIATELTPFASNGSVSATIQLGDNNDYAKGYKMTLKTANPQNLKLNASRDVWEMPSNVVNQLNTTNLVTKSPTYTVILHNLSFAPTGTESNAVRSIEQFSQFLESSNEVKIPVGGVTSGPNGQQSSLTGKYFEGGTGKLVDGTIGSFGSGKNLGSHSGKINIILPHANADQSGYVNGGQSNTTYTNNDK